MSMELTLRDEDQIRQAIRSHGTVTIPLQCGLMAKVTSMHKSRTVHLTVTLMRPGDPVVVYQKESPSASLLYTDAADALERALEEQAA